MSQLSNWKLLVVSIAGLCHLSVSEVSNCAGPYQSNSPFGCVRLCSNPTYKTCPDAFIQLFDPKYCGLTKDNKWQSYSSQCQACKSGNVIGLKDGKCTCKETGCPKGQICDINNNCINDVCASCNDWQICNNNTCIDKCATIKCTSNTQCIKGQCVPIDPCKNVKCPSKKKCDNGSCVELGKLCVPKQFKLQKCQLPRPTNKNCYTNSEPAVDVCGVNYSGKSNDYELECLACKQRSNILYYYGKCDPKNYCKEGEGCVDGVCVPNC